MGIEELCALPVADLAAPDSALFLWATFPQLPEALRLIKAWGFTYKTVAFVWLKKNKKADSWFYGLARVELCATQTPPGGDGWGNEGESTGPDFGTLCPKVGGPKGGLSCPM